MHITHGADQLRENLLHLPRLHPPVLQQMVVQLISGAVLQHQPYQTLRHYHLVQARDVGVQELAVVVDLAGEVGIVLLGRLEHDLGAIGELVGGEVDLAEAAFADEAAEGVVADGVEVGGGEFAEEGLVGVGKLRHPWRLAMGVGLGG